MKDVAREELELKLYFAMMHKPGAVPANIIEALTEALDYVRINPSIESVEASLVETDRCEENSLRVKRLSTAILIMEEHS